MDVVQLIKQDHRKVKSLFRKFEQGRAKADKQHTAEQIIEELTRHAAAEEQLLYPLLRKRDAKHDEDVLEALEEHHVAKATLLELDRMSVDDERYDAKMKVLAESIRHHIEEEESKLLPRLERLTSDDEREQLAEAVSGAKEAAPNHPHPMAPDTPPGNVIVGLLAKVIDTARDAARVVTSPSKSQARSRARRSTKSARAKQTAARQSGARARRKAS